MKPYYSTDGVAIYHGDCLDVLRELPDNSVDAVVTDPPYGLGNTTPEQVAETIRRWMNGERDYLPGGTGFMGKAWDAFVPPVAVWDEALRVLKPGGHLLAFAGSRTFDLMTLGVRLAGFEIRDSVAWLYGSGFPKSLDVSKAIDKLDAAEERLERAREFQAWLRPLMTPRRINELTGTDMGHHLTTHPTQPSVATSELFDLLRPHLPAVPDRIEQLVEQRTVESRNFAARAITGQHQLGTARGASGFTGAGEGRARRDIAHTDEARGWQGWGTALKPAFEPVVVARKPLVGTVAANVLAHGTGALNIDACRIETTDSLGGGAASKGSASHSDGWDRPWKSDAVAVAAHAATRAENVEKAESLGRWPANVILDESQAAELDQQSGVLTSGSRKPGTYAGLGYMGSESADFAGITGDSGGASRFFYVSKPDQSERVRVDGIAHPTVKPLDLMRWLVRLVTPPGGTVLEPFAGSGTTVEACLLEGFDVVAIEREADYLPLIRQRIDRRRDPAAAVKSQGVDGGLFDLLEEGS